MKEIAFLLVIAAFIIAAVWLYLWRRRHWHETAHHRPPTSRPTTTTPKPFPRLLSFDLVLDDLAILRQPPSVVAEAMRRWQAAEPSGDACAWPECGKPALCQSGNFGNRLVCSEHFRITNGSANSPALFDKDTGELCSAPGMPLVLVLWEDSCGVGQNWSEIRSDLNPETQLCRSVGWLLYDGPKCVVVLPHWAPEIRGANEQGCGEMTIPRRAIVRVVDLVNRAEPEGAE